MTMWSWSDYVAKGFPIASSFLKGIGAVIFRPWERIDQAMVEDYGLKRLLLDESLGGYEARAYIKGRFVVFDVRPVNCSQSSDGLIVPFDVIPQVLRLADAIDLRRQK